MNLRTIVMILAAGMLATACDSYAGHAQDAASSVQSSVRCPAGDFESFFNVFANDVSVQKAFTRKPLQIDYLDPAADPEPKFVSEMSSSFDFPVVPGAAEQETRGLIRSTKDLPGESVVTLEKPDTDYQVSYYFRKGACWTLYRKEDKSL